MRSLLAPASLLVLCAMLAGCPQGPAEQATDCPTDLPNDFPDTRTVEIGDVSSGQFVPYADGDTITLVKGSQGLFMITPAVRVEGKPGDGADACFRVNLNAQFGGQVGLIADVHFVQEGGAFVSDGAIYNPLGDSFDKLEGVTGTLGAKVQGEGFQGEQTVQLTLK